MTRALLYVRQSDSDGQGAHSLSMDSQSAVLHEDAARLGWTIVGELRDVDLKGYDDRRPGLLELYARCRAGDVDVVAFWDISRLARDLRIQENVFYELTRLGVELHSNRETWVSDPLPRQILGAANAHLTRMISANVRRALRLRQKRGLLQGRAPWGYLRAGKDQPLTIDPEAAPIVREMYEMRASGIGPAAIARDLTARGILTPDGHLWAVATVMKTLSHITYRGDIRAGDEILEGCHEAIVSHELWHAAQQRSGHRRAHRHKVVSSWLEGLIEHPCGYPMYLNGPYKTKAYAEFRCRVSGHGQLHALQTACPYSPRSIRQHRVETMAWEAIGALLETLPAPDQILATAQTQYQTLGPATDAARKEALGRKSRAVERQSRAEGLYLTGSRDRAWFDAEDSLALSEIAAADAQLATLPAAPNPEAIEAVWRSLHDLREAVQVPVDADRGQVLRALGVAVVTSSGRPALRNGKGDGGRVVIRVHPTLRHFFPESDT